MHHFEHLHYFLEGPFATGQSRHWPFLVGGDEDIDEALPGKVDKQNDGESLGIKLGRSHGTIEGASLGYAELNAAAGE
jgi:hypothetical protein